ncbi:MAG TPA: hypothetical protein VN253_24590 [Kofleriaceae bacterium]|nr:hypothetical protein [Kofleriaceae bacterium]
MTSKVWYVLAGGLMATAIAIAGTALSQSSATIEEMTRMVVPGRAEIVLPMGDTTLYAESRSVVDGKAYVLDGRLELHCGVADTAGTPAPIVRSLSEVSYSIGGYAGRSVFDVHIATPGTYVFECEGDAAHPFALAIGHGIGTWIVVGLVGGLVPGLLAVVVFVVVLVKRSRQRRRARAQAATPP